MPSFRDWALPALKTAQTNGEIISQMAFDIAISPQEKANFCSAMWAYGRHFRIMERDMHKKTTFDCGISSMYDEDGEGTKYLGYVEKILQVHFDSFDTVLIKGKWYNSIIRRGSTSTLMQDECGVVRIKAGRFISESSITDEPLVFPKDVSQVFFVDDTIHRGWKLVVHVNTRSKRFFYKRDQNISEESEDDDGADIRGQGAPTSVRSKETLVHVEVDDTAGEDLENGESDGEVAGEELRGNSSNDFIESDEDDQEAPLTWARGMNLEPNEVQELESNGELEEYVEPLAG